MSVVFGDPVAQKPRKLTPLETLIMGQLWDSPPASVREVQEKLKPVKPMAYNTVLTVMRVLRKKGFLASERQQRTDIYRPLVTREEMARRSHRDLVDSFYNGSAMALASHLLEAEELTPEELASLRSEIDRRLTDESGDYG